MVAHKPLRFLNTVRHLKLDQVFNRALRLGAKGFRLRPARVALGKATDVESTPLPHAASFLVLKNYGTEDVIRGKFTFLNEAETFQGSVDWSAPGKSRLWRYNLHYFDYLRPDKGLGGETATGLMKDWIAANRPGTPDAWDPFPISLRVVNWIKYLSESGVQEGDRLIINKSIYEQTLWLENSLERHLLANHFFKNLKALLFAGLFFRGSAAERWLAKGFPMLQAELKEQILSDGGHVERSPMYHSMILGDCLDLVNVCRERGGAASGLAGALTPVATDMVSFLKGLTHPDGRIALFNDAAFGIEPEPEDLYGYYERVTRREIAEETGAEQSFPDTGYYVMCPRHGDKLIIDCGPVGPDYQPGHAHCDTLSFELSLGRKRVIVDSGCFGYEDGDIRQYNRGNAGHNTLTIDGQNQSEVWGAHRCARRAYPIYAELKEENGALIFRGAHDGYQRLTGKPLHHRTVVWSGNTIRIEDQVTGGGRHEIELRLHINPELSVTYEDDRVKVHNSGETIARICHLDGGVPEVAKGWYCPEFGVKKECWVLQVASKDVRLPFGTGWTIEVGD